MEEKITVAAALLSCGHLKVWKPGKNFRSQANTNCGICYKPREIKKRTLEWIYVTN